LDDQSYIIRAERAEEFKDSVTHPWNPEAIVAGTQLSRLAGFQRLRITVLRVPPGGEASAYHAHQVEEEWLYILSGKGVIDIDEQENFLAPGDFVGFPQGSPPRQLRNPFRDPLICLIGGEHREIDITDFPRLGKRMFRHNDMIEIYDTADAEEVGPADLDEVVANSWRRSLKKPGI
jgi:uncharacterized cupin superfamily protein